MNDKRIVLRNRLASGQPTWAAGAYDALSARLVAAAGFDAVFTSGLCVSAALLGQPDVELYTMTENLSVVRHAAAAVDIPVIADGDTGYGNAINVMRTVREFEMAGAAGIVFEDQSSPKKCPACSDQLELLSIQEAEGKIRAAVAARRDPAFLIVARTDALDTSEALTRAKAYVAAGADLIQPTTRNFKDVASLRTLRQTCGVPLSMQLVGWMEDGLTRSEIEEMAGLAVFTVVPLMTAVHAMRENLEAMARDRSTRNLPHAKVDHVALNEFLGFHEIEKLQQQYLLPPSVV
ncbi:isocitrate lyase/PEP mutase family protein [Burkholderia pseudomallei]|nr:isocitrate lyase/PEP mutase family protein [Burkholderia pseudomallei]